jgi:hypothetical protein
MGYTMIEVSESKVSKMSEYAEDALHAMGRLMSCISSLEGGYGERSEGRYGNRYGGGDIGYRHEDEEMRMGMRGRSMGYREMEDDDEDFGERRGRRRRDSMGRYR